MLQHSDRLAATAILSEYLQSDLSPHHREWVTDLLRSNGFSDLVAPT
jgi:hypothetical protein